MRVLLTGHKGYIGTVMAPMLQSAGHEIVGLDSDLYRNSTFGELHQEFPEIIRDIRDIEKSDLQGIEAVVHLAGLSNDVLGDLNPELTVEINHRASVRLAEMARELGISRYVFASSCSNYGAAGDALQSESAGLDPLSAYARSKVSVEGDLRELAGDNFSPCWLRNATAYGVSPRLRFDIVLNNLVAWAFTTGKVLLKSDGRAWRPLVHIRDISRAVLAVLAAPREAVHSQAFNVGLTSENYQIRQLAGFVRDTVPGCEVSLADDAQADQRNYRVDFGKYAAAFPDFPLQWNARAGVEEVYRAYRKIGLRKDQFEGPQFQRIAQLKLLLARGELDKTLRWTH